LIQDAQRSGLLDAAAAEGLDPDEWGWQEDEATGEQGDGAIFEAQELGPGAFDEWRKNLMGTTSREVNDERLLAGILCSAYPTNLAKRVQPHHVQHCTSSGTKAQIERSSVNELISDKADVDALGLPSPSWWCYSDIRMFNGSLNLQRTTWVLDWHVALFGGLRTREKPELELDGWISIEADSPETDKLLQRLREEIRQSLVWLAIAASWDRVAQAATVRAKALLNILGRVIVEDEPNEDDMNLMRDWKLPELEDGNALGANEEDWEEVEARLWKNTVVELKVILRELKQKVSGRKADLVERCANALIYGSDERPGEQTSEETEE